MVEYVCGESGAGDKIVVRTVHGVYTSEPVKGFRNKIQVEGWIVEIWTVDVDC